MASGGGGWNTARPRFQPGGGRLDDDGDAFFGGGGAASKPSGGMLRQRPALVGEDQRGTEGREAPRRPQQRRLRAARQQAEGGAPLGNRGQEIADPGPERRFVRSFENFRAGAWRPGQSPRRGAAASLRETLEADGEAEAPVCGEAGETRPRRDHRDRRRTVGGGHRREDTLGEPAGGVRDRERGPPPCATLRGRARRAERDAGDGAEGAERPGEEFGQLVAGHILHHPAAGADAGAIGEDRPHPEQEVAGPGPGNGAEAGLARGRSCRRGWRGAAGADRAAGTVRGRRAPR